MSAKLFSSVVAALVMSASFLAFTSDAGQDTRVFEMRTYTTNDGKLDLLHKRFRDHTNRIFQKHGMDLVGYWTPTDGETSENTLVYVLAYPDREARDRSWEAFIADPEWQEVFSASREEADGPIVSNIESVFLAPTDYSPIR